MNRLAAISILIALGFACGPSGYDPAGFDTDYSNPDQGTPTDSDTDTGGGGTGLPSTNGGHGQNNPPRAEAAATPDRGIVPPQSVTLDATGSSDIDGDTLAYVWEITTQPPGANATIANAPRATASILIEFPGIYTIGLTVSDGKAESTDSITLNVANPNGAPIANAGPDLTVDVGTVVNLSGAASSDPEGDALQYAWTLINRPSGSTAPLQGVSIPEIPTASFVADVAGTFVASLTVSDGDMTSRADLVNIIARPVSTGGSGGVSTSSSGSSSCLDCAAQASDVASTTWSAGDVAGSFGLLILPVFVALWQRRRED